MAKEKKEIKVIGVNEIDVDAFVAAVKQRCQVNMNAGKFGGMSKDQMLMCVHKLKAARPDIVSFERLLLRLLKEKRITSANGSFWVDSSIPRYASKEDCNHPRKKKKVVPSSKRQIQMFEGEP